MSEQSERDVQRYKDAVHAMQSGVAMTMNWDPHSTTPKHLRVGVNSALVESGVIAKLLIDKGIITEDEWAAALADGMEAEAERYRKEIQAHFGERGPQIHLA